jgi:hypothetical protein
MALDTTIGGASADSYGTLADYQTYGANLGWTLSGVDATDEQNLRRAAQIIDREYQFKGHTQYQVQALEFPRVDVGLVKGWPVDPDTIPQDIKDAQFELAFLLQGGLNPTATITGVVKVERSKAGPVETETEYQGGKAEPRLVAIRGLLDPYLSFGGNQVRLDRA